MATVKIGTLVIRTLAKPISNRIKMQAKEHPRFRNLCISLAQGMYRSELRLRTNLLGEPAKHIRPLSEARAIENGANFLAEGFLFSVAAGLILGESWRSARSASKRRDDVDERLEALQASVGALAARAAEADARWLEANERNDELTRILERVVEIGLKGGWAELQDTPLKLPRIEFKPPDAPGSSSSSPPSIAPS